jgi:hypothetical protein
MSAKLLVPVERIELPTFGLQNRCSTAELNRLILSISTIRSTSEKFWRLCPRHRYRRGGRAVKYQSCLVRATATEIARKPCPKSSPDANFVEGIRSAGGETK